MAIITISRMYGSGGTTFSKELAKTLGYEYVDKDYIDQYCKSTNSNICTYGLDDEEAPDFLERLNELFTNKSFFKLSLMATIYSLALKDNVIFCGRGANFILSGLNNLLSLQVVANLSKRVQSIAKIKNISIDESKDLIDKKDKEKKEFIEYYFDKDVFNSLHYHIVLNSSYIDLNEAIEIVKVAIKKFDQKDNAKDIQWLKERLVESKANILLFRLGLVHTFGKIDFECSGNNLKVKGVIGSEEDKKRLFENLKHIEDVKNIEDHLNIGILSHIIY